MSDIYEGFTLMLAGMGTVFLFLTVLVGVTMAMGAFFLKHADRFADPVPVAHPQKKAAGTGDEAEIAVAIAAVHTLHS